MTTEKTRGHCLCGAILFEVTGNPIWVGHCHCESCRRNTGSALATFVGLRPEQIKIISGERKLYESSPGVRRSFCDQCGTPLSYEADRFPNEVHLYISTLDEPEKFQPQFHVFYSEKIPWFEVMDDLPRHNRTSKG